MGGAMLWFVVWGAITLLQLAAASAGVAHCLGIPFFVAFLIVAIASVASPLTAIAGVYGAIAVWQWNWFLAVCLFFFPLVIGATVFGTINAFGVVRRLTNRAEQQDTVTDLEHVTKVDNSSHEASQRAARSNVVQTMLADEDQGTPKGFRTITLVVLVLALFAWVGLYTGQSEPPYQTRADNDNSGSRFVPAVQPSLANTELAPIESVNPPSDETALIPAAESSVDTSHFSTPSFECSLVTHRVEHMICSSFALAELDRILDQLYQTVLFDAASPDALRKDQAQWLTTVRNWCQDAECIDAVYRQRIGLFRNELASPVADTGNQSVIHSTGGGELHGPTSKQSSVAPQSGFSKGRPATF